MAAPSNTGKAGIIVAPDDAGSMDKLAHSVLDDVLHNIISDLLLKVHRDEKQARAMTAAIRIEKLASDNADSSAHDARPDLLVETDAAIYDHGKVLLKGNPLKTTKDILCPRCNLPRLLYPVDGKGARKPDPTIIYCKRHPYIEKPGFDIYGQTWMPPGPGRGKKKKDLEKKDGDSQGEADAKNAIAVRPPNVLSFPSATCSKCKRCILVTRLNNHMGSCIGNSGRNASRAAAEKMKNGGNGDGSGTPPSSQKGTPLPASRASSPRKRDGGSGGGGDDETPAGGADDANGKTSGSGSKNSAKHNISKDSDDDDEDVNPKKKKLKPSPAVAAVTKKVILKTKGPKKEKVKTGSLLSNESKPDDANAKDAAGAGHGHKETQVPPPTIPAPTSTTPIVPPKKKMSTSKIPSPAKKLKLNGPKTTLGAVAAVAKPPKAVGKDADAGSESSGTLSSPPRP